MTNRTTDSCTGTTGTLFNAHVGEVGATWTLGAGFTANIPVLSDANRVRGGGAGGCCIFASGVATTDGEYQEAVIQVITTAAGFGIFARGHANLSGVCRGYMGYYDTATGTWKGMRLDNNKTFTQIGSNATRTLSVGAHTVRATVTGTGASVEFKVDVDGSNVLTVTDSTAGRITTFGSAGLYFDTTASNSAGTHVESLVYEDAAGTAGIAITTPVDGKINQRSGTTGTVSVAGTYAGTPTSIEARLVLDGTSTAVSGFDWATKVASPTGNAYSFSFTGAPEGVWYNVQVRHANNTAINATSGKVGVGALVAIDGQSQVWLWFSPTAYAGDSSLTPDAKLRIAGIQPTAWDVPATATMNGAIAFGNALVAGLNTLVGLIDGTWNGSGLTVSGNGGQWISGGAAGNAYTASAAAIAAETTAIEGTVFIQGEADAAASVSQSTHYTGLGQMIALRRTAVGDANSPYVVALLARDLTGTSTDAKRQAINLALDQKCGDANIYRVERYDLALHTDNIHHPAAAQTILGQRCARALLSAKGVVSTYRGPRITSVLKISGAVFDVTLTHNNGSDFTPTSGITGWRVTDGGTPVTLSTAVRTAADKVRLTLASAPSALPVVQYDYGMAPDITGVLKDNSALTLPLEFSGGITATADAAVSSGTGTSTGSGSGGEATGQINASASGGAGTSTGSGTGGSATGVTNAAASGGTGSGTGSGTGGEAIGQINASASGGTGTSTGSGSGGDAAGQTAGSATASGGSGTSTGSGTGGTATAVASATAAGGTGSSTGSGTGGTAIGGTAAAVAQGGTGSGAGSGTGGAATGEAERVIPAARRQSRSVQRSRRVNVQAY